MEKLNYHGIVDLNKNTWNNQVICDTTLMKDKDGYIVVLYGGGNASIILDNVIDMKKIYKGIYAVKIISRRRT